jgi:cation transport ATPase
MLHNPSPPNQFQEDAQPLAPQPNQLAEPEQRTPPAEQVIRSSDRAGAHAESQYAAYTDASGTSVERRQETVEDTYQRQANRRVWVTRTISVCFSVLEVVLALRLLFRLLGANTQNSFITLLYRLSHVFVSPFNGIFNDQALGNHSVFEVSTLIAIALYALIAWGLVALAETILRPSVGSRERTMTTRRRSR